MHLAAIALNLRELEVDNYEDEVGKKGEPECVRGTRDERKRYSGLEGVTKGGQEVERGEVTPWLPSGRPWPVEKCYAGLGGDDDDVLLMNAE